MGLGHFVIPAQAGIQGLYPFLLSYYKKTPKITLAVERRCFPPSTPTCSLGETYGFSLLLVGLLEPHVAVEGE